MIKKVHNSLSVHENLWTLKFDNFSEVQKAISDNLSLISVIMTHYVRKLICDSPLTCYTVCFYRMLSWGLSKYNETKSCRAFAFTSFNASLKHKMKSRSKSSCLFFAMVFEEKYISCYILLPDQVSLSCCLYFVRYSTMCVLQLFVNQVMTS